MKHYDGWFKRWWVFCIEAHHDPWVYSLSHFINFLNKQAQSGKSFSAVNSCKAALSFILPISSTDEPLIKRYLKGIYNQNPPKPKYDTTWDPYPVLSFLEKLVPLDRLTLEQLSYKLVTLLALISAHRVQTLSKIKIHNIIRFEDRLEILIPDRMKSSGKNRQQPVLKIPFFLDKPELCLATCILFYIEKTESFREEGYDTLILTHKRPFHAASSQTISRWIKHTLKMSGISTEQYSGHSVRHAATSAANRGGVSVEEIRKRAGWTEKSATFNRFYNRPLAVPPDLFARGLLKGSNVNS